MKLRLTVILSGRAFQEHEFQDFTSIAIGRSPECEVRIDNLGISRRHAEIKSEAGLVVLYDLGSGNGVQVNGARVKHQPLNDGDVIAIGKFTIGVTVVGKMAPVVLTRSTEEAGGRTMGASEAALEAAHEAGTFHAFVKNPTVRGSERVLTRPWYLFGSDAELDFTTKGGLLAPRLVAALVREETCWRVLDVTAAGNEIRVNGEPTTDRRLSHGDRIDVRGQQLLYQVGRPEGH